MERRLGRMIRSMSVTGMVGFSGAGTGWEPAVDMFETSDAVLVYMDAAGVDPKALTITVDGDRLTVSGERSFPEREVSCVHQLEIEYGPFQRTLHLPVAVDPEGASSFCKNGLLVVRLPKRRPRGKVLIEVT